MGEEQGLGMELKKIFSGVLRYSFCALIIITLFAVSDSQKWTGNLETYKRWEMTTCKQCICRYQSGCAEWRNFSCNAQVNANRCLSGWNHTGDYNCIVPICRPDCGEGTCTRPSTCDCKGLATGQFCQTLACSYRRPCYPGNCYDNSKCNCATGFTKTGDYGCMNIASDNRPNIGKSTIIIQHIRRTDDKFFYNFLLDGTDETTMSKLVVWSNQRFFNEMNFEFEIMYDQPEPLLDRPVYVHDTKLGITNGSVSMRVFDYKGEEHPTHKYDTNCTGSSRDNPVEIFNCTISGEKFKTLIEHADTLNVTFKAENGGYRKLIRNRKLQPKEYFRGQTGYKHVYFKFDFQAPKHCSEPKVDGYTLTSCGENATMLDVGPEFTKDPITVYWKDWTDDKYGSQMWIYYLELHKLVVKDATLELTERDPIEPMDTALVKHMGNVAHKHTFTPKEAGIYSILLEVRDISNNSRIARRFVVYDKVSDVELNSDSPAGLHISSAENHTGFIWQHQGKEGEDTHIIVNWTDYFMNKAHEDGYYNNKIQTFKAQFQNMEDDGILSFKKFVDPKLDDKEGLRTLDSILNIHGIVQFEYQYSRNVELVDPEEAWLDVEPLSETTTITETMSSGDQIKVWVRARDVLGNRKIDTTMVNTDFSAPIVSGADDKTTTYMEVNDPNGPFNYSSRLHLEAYDKESGVHEIGVDISIHAENMPDKIVRKTVKANTYTTRNPDIDPNCVPSKDKSTCFLRDQTIYLDNCWLTLPNQDYLTNASATVIVRAYNQAMLTSNVVYEIPSISDLKGLDPYTGPNSVEIENVKTGSFRIVWDFPEKMSCYAIQTTITIVLLKKQSDGTAKPEIISVPGSKTHFDIANLDPQTEYEFTFQSEIGGDKSEALTLKATTASEPTDNGFSNSVLVGVTVGAVVIVAMVIVIFVVLVHRGCIYPRERVRRVKRAVTKKYRDTFYGREEAIASYSNAMSNASYDPESGRDFPKRQTMSEQEELYMYGGMDINMPEVEHIDRDHITFEGVIKDGHFARIYKATLRKGSNEDTVVLKTLKENFSTADEEVMRAKINFTGTVVGSHPNILKFLGAVVGDDHMGPYIVQEYCENGTMRDFLVSRKNNVTLELEEYLFRFGLDIAKGMEYLASKGIVHRRLAARNILLTFLYEVKISGFGPQPAFEDDRGSNKQELIPIKWMAPECMTSTRDATERSDVWSYAVVLWEIFSMGDTPYPKMKSRRVPMALKKGQRLPKLKQCSDTWYAVMTRCWAYEPSKRPVFAEIRTELDEMFVASLEDDIYYYKR